MIHRSRVDQERLKAEGPGPPSLRRRERRPNDHSLEAQLERAEMRLQLLTLHPHLVCNALHAAAHLVHVDADRAERVIVRLGALLRGLLDNSERLEISLEEELVLLRAYLDIEAIRFPEVTVSFAIEPRTLRAIVPQLLLQPLVENSFRHGLRGGREGRIDIGANRRAGRLHLSVCDNGGGLPLSSEVRAERLGLGMTRARLERLYGPLQRFLIRDDAQGGVLASIAIPFRAVEDVERAVTPPAAEAPLRAAGR